MAKRKTIADVRLPIPSKLSLSNPPTTQGLKPKLQKQIVQQAVQAAYSITDYDLKRYGQPDQLVADENINMVTNLIQSIQPTNSVEAALAVQFTSTYIQGMRQLQSGNCRWALPLLALSQTSLDSLNRYRNKGMQQINVQYNVNQGQVVNIKNQKVSKNE